jgi:serine/threonine-protein kinase ULK4
MLVNSSFTPLWLSLLRSASVVSLKLRLATLLALLLRHTTFVTAALARGELLLGLTEALKDRSDKVRRRVMAALGELLFYITVRQQQARRLRPPSSAGPSRPRHLHGGTRVHSRRLSRPRHYRRWTPACR